MGLLALLNRRPPWHWRGSGAPSPQAVAAAAAALRRADRRPAAKAEKAAVLSLLARLVDPKAAGNSPAAAAAAAAALSDAGLLEAVTAAVHPDAQPSEPAVEAATNFAAALASASPAAAAALGDSGLVGSLAALLEAPSTHVSPDSKLDALGFLRRAATRAPLRDAMEEEGAPAAVVAALQGAIEAGDWPLAGEAAWALELMAAMSRRLTSAIGEAGGVEAALALLRAARQEQPALRELPRDEEAAEAAATALHALLALLADNRRHRGRLQRAGGAAELSAAFQDERLGWEAQEQAAGLLQDLAAALPLDTMAVDDSGGAAAATAATAASGSSGRRGGGGAGAGTLEDWRGALLPALVGVLAQRRGGHLQEAKEAAAGVLAKYAANGAQHAAAAREAGALTPLLQLLHGGSQLAGGQRRAAIAALTALEPLVSEPGCQEELAGPCASASGPLDLLGRLRPLLAAATAPELDLSAYSTASGSDHTAAAGWHAAAVAARACGGAGAAAQQLQDAAVARGLLPLLARFAVVEVQAPGGFSWTPVSPEAAQSAELLMSIKCDVTALLRSLSMRRGHHPALRACPGLLPGLHRALLPGSRGWAEGKAAAKRVLINLGELEDTDRPLLTYTAPQLGALLRQAGISPGRFVDAGVSGAEFVRLSDGRLRELAAPGELPRVLRVLRAHEAFAEIDACGARSGSLGLPKLLTHLLGRGVRHGEAGALAEGLLELMDGDRDGAVAFPDFLRCYDEFLARTLADLQPPSKKRRTDSRL